MGIDHVDVEYLVVIVAAEASHVVTEREGVTRLRVPNAQGGIQRIFRRSADLEIERQHDVPGTSPGCNERGAGSGKLFVNRRRVRFELAGW